MIGFRTQMTTSYAELDETCAATTYPPPQGAAKRLATGGVALGIVVFFGATYAAAAFRPVVPNLVLSGVLVSWIVTLAKTFRGVASASMWSRMDRQFKSKGRSVVATKVFAKFRVSQSDLRSKNNRK